MRGYRDGRFTDGPYVDWLRTNVRDSRFEPEAVASVTDTGELPDNPSPEADAIDAVIESLAGGLSERSAWTLRHVASALAGGLTLDEVCEGLLKDLADDLRTQIPGAPETGTVPPIEFFETWLKEAA
jgi:hypothetical protein